MPKRKRDAIQRELDDLLDNPQANAESVEDVPLSPTQSDSEEAPKVKKKVKTPKKSDEKITTATALYKRMQLLKSKYPRPSGLNNFARANPDVTLKYHANLVCQIFQNDIHVTMLKHSRVILDLSNAICYGNNARNPKYKFSYLSLILNFSDHQYRQQVYSVIHFALLSMQAEKSYTPSFNPEILDIVLQLPDYQKPTKLYQSILAYFNRVGVYPEEIKLILNILIENYISSIQDEQEIAHLRSMLESVENLRSESLSQPFVELAVVNEVQSMHMLSNFKAILKALGVFRSSYYNSRDGMNNLDPTNAEKMNADFYCRAIGCDVKLQYVMSMSLLLTPYFKVFQDRCAKVQYSFLSIILMYANDEYRSNVFSLLHAIFTRIQANPNEIDCVVNPKIHTDLNNSENDRCLYQGVLEYFVHVGVCPEQLKALISPMLSSYIQICENEDEVAMLNDLLASVEGLPSENFPELNDVMLAGVEYAIQSKYRKKKIVDLSESRRLKRRKTHEDMEEVAPEFVENASSSSSSSSSSTTNTTNTDVNTKVVAAKAPRRSYPVAGKAPRYLEQYRELLQAKASEVIGEEMPGYMQEQPEAFQEQSEMQDQLDDTNVDMQQENDYEAAGTNIDQNNLLQANLIGAVNPEVEATNSYQVSTIFGEGYELFNGFPESYMEYSEAFTNNAFYSTVAEPSRYSY